MKTSKDDAASKKDKFDRDMADAFRSMRDDAVRIALGEVKLQLDLSPEGELAKMAAQAGPASFLPFQKQLEQLDNPKFDPRASKAAKARIKSVLLDSIYDPLYPVPRNEFAKAVATLRDLSQLQGKAAAWEAGSSIGQAIQELTALFNHRKMTLTNAPEHLRRMVAIYLAMKCQTCSALGYAWRAQETGMRIILTEHEAFEARMKAAEATEKERLYTLLGQPAKSEEARQIADEANDKSWELSRAAGTMRDNNPMEAALSHQMQNVPGSESDDKEKYLPIQQQEAFGEWRKWLADNNVKLSPKMRTRYHHFKDIWVPKTRSVVWGPIVSTITFERFCTLWESYERSLSRHSPGHFHAPK